MRRLVVALAVLVASVGLAPVPTQAAPAAAGFSTAYQRIPGAGGTEIGAVVLTPTGQGAGPFPLVVMPSSWGVPNLEYVGQGSKLAKAGFQVISYSSRGFWDSAGGIDIAGPPTVADVTEVIDWAAEHTPADTSRVASVGISYGAGISLLASAQDPRIKAVGALSGWADLIASLNPNDTVNLQAVAALLALGNITGRPGPEMRSLQTKFVTGDFDGAISEATALAPIRSATTVADRINANHPAVFLANAFEDSIFPPTQYTDFFTKLTGPKRLLLAHGDHATPEVTGAIGLPNEVWDELAPWLQHFLTGAENGADDEAPVQLKSQRNVWRSYPNWASVGSTKTSYLTKPTGLSRTGSLQAKASTGWSNGIGPGIPTVADSGVVLISGALQGLLSIPVGVATPLVDRTFAGVWSGPAYSSKTVVNGAPRLHVTVTPSARDTSLFAYLYDVDAFGFGSLVSHKPYTLRGATPGQPKTLDLRLEATSWEVPAGHHLVLVVDTVDPRYLGRSSLGSTVSFSSPAADPSWLSVPVA
ncbi:CocE/NonD family hydrolase [Streptomyces sp. SID13031]|uniref:CocE/NonD family hydrolase n=1 Tax=Streptomyces sp. SID13031 TaxID=2706046 RepID=UPI0013CD254D|nr:CocE/NonD family hydrolase [Streptomyces sp. SID13031]NEA33445.1 CocE/NonD family hydrolase [Streptomyces sp. SID13031]